MNLWISVLELGTFYGLLALAYLLVIEGARFFNFLVGAYAMTAAMLTSWLTERGWSLPMAILAALVVGTASAAITEIGLIRPIQKRSRDELTALVAVTAGLMLIQQIDATLMGRTLFPGRPIIEGDPISIGSGSIEPTGALQIVLTIVIFAAMSLYLSRSNTGRSLRAVGDNEEAATIVGLPVQRIRLAAFVLSGALAAIAGVLFSARSGVSFQSGFPWTIYSFLAIVIGGTGSVWSPLAGGLILGALQTFVPRYVGSGALDYAIFGIALIFFAFRPEGVFARRVRI